MTGKHAFSCTLCGECCSGSMEVFLNSYDLFKIGRFMKMRHTRELFKANLIEWAPGQNGLTLPRIRFKERPYPFCPFLINDYQEDRGLRGLCSLHPDQKPLVCQLAPHTREVDLETGKNCFGFIPPYPECPGCGKGEVLYEEAIGEDLRIELDQETDFYRRLSKAAVKGPESVKKLFLYSLDKSSRE